MKAYKNAEFLNSPAAREIRILSEFLEPATRFRRQGIRNTIVVFGSARIHSMAVAKKNLRLVQVEVARKGLKGKRLEEKLEKALHSAEMSRYYEDAVQLTSMLTRWSETLRQERQFVICSGGGPGIMEAANKGAYLAGGKSIGLNITLPFEQKSNRYVSKELSFEFHYFFMRKFWFVYLAKALVMFPGGFGTFDELFEVLTLVQTQKVVKPMPVILYGPEYWNEVLNFAALEKHNTISHKDRQLFRFADTPEEAFSSLKKALTETYKEQNHTRVRRKR
jgi:uncharacterized protein (TIGR00730 family)